MHWTTAKGAQTARKTGSLATNTINNSVCVLGNASRGSFFSTVGVSSERFTS